MGALAGTNPRVELGANSASGGDDNLSRDYSTAIEKSTDFEVHLVIVFNLLFGLLRCRMLW